MAFNLSSTDCFSGLQCFGSEHVSSILKAMLGGQWMKKYIRGT